MTTPCKKEIARILPFLGLMINIYRHDKYAAIQASYSLQVTSLTDEESMYMKEENTCLASDMDLQAVQV